MTLGVNEQTRKAKKMNICITEELFDAMNSHYGMKLDTLDILLLGALMTNEQIGVTLRKNLA